jgi:hypothetical protein
LSWWLSSKRQILHPLRHNIQNLHQTHLTLLQPAFLTA